MNSISSAEKLAIDMDFTRCGGFSPLLFTTNATCFFHQFQYHINPNSN